MIHKYCDWCKKPVKKVGKLLRRGKFLLCKSCREKWKKKQNLKRVLKSKAKRFR